MHTFSDDEDLVFALKFPCFGGHRGRGHPSFPSRQTTTQIRCPRNRGEPNQRDCVARAGALAGPASVTPFGSDCGFPPWAASDIAKPRTRAVRGLACIYAAAYPVRVLVVVDSGPDLRPFAELIQGLAPALDGTGFAGAWPTFENSLGLERIPAPVRSVVLAGHQVDQDVVVGYWEPLLRADPAELQAWIDDQILPEIDTPCLGVFGRLVTTRERERLARLADVQLEEWTGDGHFVHLVDPDRFTTSLRRFIEHCTAG